MKNKVIALFSLATASAIFVYLYFSGITENKMLQYNLQFIEGILFVLFLFIVGNLSYGKKINIVGRRLLLCMAFMHVVTIKYELDGPWFFVTHMLSYLVIFVIVFASKTKTTKA